MRILLRGQNTATLYNSNLQTKMEESSDCTDKELLKSKSSIPFDQDWGDISDEELLNGCLQIEQKTSNTHKNEMTFDELLDFLLAKKE